MFISAAPIKRTAVERQVNIHIVFLFVFLLALSIGSTIGSSIREVSLLVMSPTDLAYVRHSGFSPVHSGI